MIKFILSVTLLLGIVTAASYRPRGWRPNGPPFDATHIERLRTYGNPHLPQEYGSPDNRPSYPQHTTTTTKPAITTAAPTTTTTPRTREPTTTPNILDQDFESNPALAIANSFAFNRPVYVYNTFPFNAGLTFVK